jgi:lipase maturation factor 1
MPKPLVIYDGDCNFCKRWIHRWHAHVGSAVDFEPYQTAAQRFPSVPRHRFEKAMHFVDCDGSMVAGAEAAFRLFDKGRKRSRLYWMYRNVPGFKPLAEAMYGLIARHRVFFSRFF